MVIDTQFALQEYTALRDAAALQLRPDAGVLALTDADRADFLQRMTTNNVAALRPGQACVTVLTSPTAKIVQVFTVVWPASWICSWISGGLLGLSAMMRSLPWTR